VSQESEAELEKNMNNYLKRASQKIGSAQVVAAKIIGVTPEKKLEILNSMAQLHGGSQPNARINWKEAQDVRLQHELLLEELCEDHRDDLIKAGYIEARGDALMVKVSHISDTIILAYQLGEWDFRPVMIQGEHEE